MITWIRFSGTLDMQLLEFRKTVHFASTLFRDSIKYLYITLINTFIQVSIICGHTIYTI